MNGLQYILSTVNRWVQIIPPEAVATLRGMIPEIKASMKLIPLDETQNEKKVILILSFLKDNISLDIAVMGIKNFDGNNYYTITRVLGDRIYIFQNGEKKVASKDDPLAYVKNIIYQYLEEMPPEASSTLEEILPTFVAAFGLVDMKKKEGEKKIIFLLDITEDNLICDISVSAFKQLDGKQNYIINRTLSNSIPVLPKLQLQQTNE